MATPVNMSTKVPANAGRQVNRAGPLSCCGKPFGGAGTFSAGHNLPLLTPVTRGKKGSGRSK